MTTLAILQARSSSSRFPRKVLADLHGEPMILRQLERVRRSTLIDDIVVATSDDPSDDELSGLLAERGVAVNRGPLDDVLARFARVVGAHEGAGHVIRLTADCPLADPQVIDHVVAEHRRRGTDYTSNTLRPTYPDGLDVEVMTRAAFERLLTLPLTAHEREHVTAGLYGRPEEFALGGVEQRPDRSALRWTVDVPADLAFVAAVYAALYDENPGFGQADVLALLDARPGLSRTDRDLARNAGSAPPQEDRP